MSLFDPETGKVVDRAALKSVHFNGQGMTVPRSWVNDDDTKTTEVLDDNTGRRMAHTTEHASGRVDANVFPEPVKAGAHLRQ